MKWLIVILGIIANASASVLIKVSVTAPRSLPSFNQPLAAFSNWPFWLGLILYGSAFLLYVAALARLPLNVAHPILTSGAIAAVALSSSLVFKEPFPWTTGVGILFVIVGVIFISVRLS